MVRGIRCLLCKKEFSHEVVKDKKLEMRLCSSDIERKIVHSKECKGEVEAFVNENG